jgi:hypothetical protein
MSGVFAQWQPVYAEHNIPTFPCGPDKRPAVTNYGRFGLAASNQIASRSGADALGFMCGKRSGVTVLDVDTTDEGILADALSRHGKTRIITRSGRGRFHAWYRHNGERRWIRPRRDMPIDILGGGYVVAPPSRVAAGQYQFVEGSLNDLHSLTVLHNLAQGLSVDATPTDWANMREGDGRNAALFSLLGRAAHRCDDFDQLLDYAQTQNGQLGEPMQDAEVVKVSQSVWKMQCEGRNRFGQYGAWVPLKLSRKLAQSPDAYALYGVLKAENGPASVFPIANGMAQTAIGLRRYRLANARKVIIGLELVEEVCPQTRHKPAFYRWPKPQGLEGEGGGVR